MIIMIQDFDLVCNMPLYFKLGAGMYVVNVLYFLKVEEVNGTIVTVCPVSQADCSRLHLCQAPSSEL
jgi:hypothetical protein